MAVSGLQKLTNSISESLKEELKTPLLEGESLIESQGCSRAIKGGISAGIGGTLFFTNQRIIFETNKLHTKIKDITDIIDVNTVTKFCKADNIGLGMAIAIAGVNKDKNVIISTNTDGYNYTPQDPDRVIEILSQICPNATLGEKSSYSETMKGNFFGRSVNKTEAPNTSQVVTQQIDVATEIKKFKELLDIGAITEEEFEAKKKQLLGL